MILFIFIPVPGQHITKRIYFVFHLFQPFVVFLLLGIQLSSSKSGAILQANREQFLILVIFDIVRFVNHFLRTGSGHYLSCQTVRSFIKQREAHIHPCWIYGACTKQVEFGAKLEL